MSSRSLRSQLLLTPDEVAATAPPTEPTPEPTRAPRRAPTMPRLAPGRWLEGTAIVAIVALAAAVRFYRLESLPYGIHGDEAIAGMEGARILREGWIGPYSPEALGQPAGPLYLTALAVRLFGPTVFAVRFAPALLGVLAVAAVYLVARRSFGAVAALIAALLLATMNWHIHYARIGFPLEAWPLSAILTAGALVEATRRGDWRWWACTGFLAGLGIYSYNADVLLLAITGLFVALWVVGDLFRRQARPIALRLVGPALCAVVLLITAWPMIGYATRPNSDYLMHARATSIFERPEWEELDGRAAQARFLLDRYTGYWGKLCCQQGIDGGDAAGTVPLVQKALLALAVAGALIGCLRRRPLAYLAVLTIVLLPLAPVTTTDGFARRTLASAPFLAILAALPLAWLVAWRPLGDGAKRWRPLLVAAQVAVVVAALLPLGYRGVADYFRILPRSNEIRWVFSDDLYDATRYMLALPDGSYVYFYGGRWPLRYESIAFLAPDLQGEDRSREYGQRTDIVSDRTGGTIAYVFFGDYANLLPQVQERYPGGTIVFGNIAGRRTFVAYQVELGAAGR